MQACDRQASVIVIIATIVALALVSPMAARAAAPAMTGFASDAAVDAFFKRRGALIERRDRVAGRSRGVVPSTASSPAFAPPPPPAVASPAATAVAVTGDVVVTGTRTANAITNTQEPDVDEGGIVKVHGDHLVILRRGRLFTVALADRTLRAVATINAFPPGAIGEDAWYDEMLVSGDRVIVIGFSYGRGGTEINRFRIGSDGRLTYEDTHHLRSNDYYSSSNYASRLIGDTLIVYTPLDLDTAHWRQGLPGVRRLGARDYTRTLPPTQLYLPAPLGTDLDADLSTLHTVTRCDLAARDLSCTSTGVLGGEARNFYVSGRAVYVWLADAVAPRRGAPRAMVYRLPLDGSAASAVQVWGGPLDQFSFREDRMRDRLDVLVQADARGEAMWRSEVREGDAALAQIPLSRFGDGSDVVPASAYRALPLNKDAWSLHNRFVGRHLVYSAGEFDDKAGYKTVFAVPVDGGAIAQVRVPHGVDRIDIIGSDAIAIGNDARDRLGFSAIELGPRTPRLGDSFLPAAREGERRSQAFFFRPDTADGTSGMLGLPVTRALADSRAARFLGSGSAIAFLRRDARRFAPAGELVANTANAHDDACQASCVDWYGNARPIFLRDRVFALMGYELVEGRVAGGLIGEAARIDFAPVSAARRALP